MGSLSNAAFKFDLGLWNAALGLMDADSDSGLSRLESIGFKVAAAVLFEFKTVASVEWTASVQNDTCLA